MARNPKIPMRPEDIPQQRIRLVVDLPPRPENFTGYCDFVSSIPEEVRPKGSPRKLEYIGSVEWASGPRDTRFDAYYLNPRGKYWFLWNYFQDENSWDLSSSWVLYAYGLKRGADAKTAAIYLLLDAWKAERDDMDLGKYFLIDDTGLLSVAEISEIGRRVWPDKASRK